MTDYYKILTVDDLVYAGATGELVTEQWRLIAGYPNYKISNIGRVKSLCRVSKQNKKIREKMLKQQKTMKGYLFVCLCNDNGKQFFLVHRLVGNYFLENVNNKETINHKKGIKTDNRYFELEWATHSENNKHSFDVLKKVVPSKGKFGADAHRSKKIKCLDTGEIFHSRNEAALKLNISASSISNVCNKKYRQIKGHKFEYL